MWLVQVRKTLFLCNGHDCLKATRMLFERLLYRTKYGLAKVLCLLN